MSQVLQPVSFEVDVKSSTSPTAKKPAVASRLESWQSPAVSIVDIENRLDSANASRLNIQENQAKKITTRIEKASAKKIRMNQEYEKAVSTLAQNSEAKMSKAVQSKETMINQTVSKTSQHNAKVATSMNKHLSAEANATAKLANSTATKLGIAGSNHNATMAKKILTASLHNDRVKQAHAGVLAEQHKKMSELSQNIQEKMTISTENKNAILEQKSASAAPRSPSKKNDDEIAAAAATSELAEKTRVKMEGATIRREAFLNDRISSATKKSRSPTSNNNNQDQLPTTSVSDIEIRLEEAASRRELLLVAKQEQAAFHNNAVATSAKAASPNKKLNKPRELHSDNDPIPEECSTPRVQKEISEEDVEEHEKEGNGCHIA